MPQHRPDAKPCPRGCGRLGNVRYPEGLCRTCYDEKRAQEPKNLAKLVKQAQKSGDWKSLAEELGDTIKGVADGSIEATAAQSSLLKHIMDRAYGRVTKSQEDAAGPVGVVVLPTLDVCMNMSVCPVCLEYHLKHG